MNIVKPKLRNETEITVVCSYCGKLIKGQKLWNKEYFTAKEISLLPVSHGICPKCLCEYFPNEYLAILNDDTPEANSLFAEKK